MLTPPEILFAVVERLRAYLFPRLRVPAEQACRLLNRLGRLGRRFMVLAAQFQAGTLRPARLRAARPRDPDAAPTPRAPDLLPRKKGWLGDWMGEAVAAPYRGAMLSALQYPEVRAMIAADARFGRLLRPLHRMLTPAPLPEVLRLPKRARRGGAVDAGQPADSVSPSSSAQAADPRLAVVPPRSRGWSASAERDGGSAPPRRRSRINPITGLPHPRRFFPA